ncbi:general secretion pathway protein GspK [Asaia sp. W19]|uniref:general secretion pathway protein GspK n=1 Tax=unclassified Asaia TaxID=2685023 RepID=UPI000F8D777D|nr:type II secretion system protein GspK [Asaia sp. W19]RUT26389.1 general secretion pathway protein GspK [Asaia sp. W19]
MSAPPFSGARKADERGFALLITLWTLAGLAFLVTMILAAAGSELREMRLARRTTQMQTLAEGALWSGVFHAMASSGQHWAGDNAPHQQNVDGMILTIRLRSEAGLINPSLVERPLLQALIAQCGADAARAESLAANIIAWRSPASSTTASERNAYLAAGLPYQPPHAAFETIGELGLVSGMTPALLACLRPHLSATQPEAPHTPLADPVIRAAYTRSGGSPLPAARPGGHRAESIEITVDVQDGQGGMIRRAATWLIAPGTGSTPLRLASAPD